MSHRLLATLPLVALVACSSQPARKVAGRPGAGGVDATVAANTLANESLKNFDTKISEKLIADGVAEGKNAFVSPLSIHLALSLLANGARSSTQENILNTLNLDPRQFTLGDLNAANMAQVEGLNRASQRFEEAQAANPYLKGSAFKVIIANAVWGKHGIVPEPSYQATLESAYQSEFKTMDANAVKAAGEINQWAHDNTNGKVSKIIEPQTLANPDFKMLLANATYVKASWLKKFNLMEQKMNFKSLKGKSLMVQGMKRTTETRYMQTAELTAVQLPLQGEAASFFIVMPNDTKAFKAQSAKIWSAKFWDELASSESAKMRFGNVALTMPATSFTYKKKLNDTLKALGMNVPFDSRAADFGAMTRSEPLFLAFVNHDSFVKIDENGFEGAAVTSAGMMTRSAHIPQPEIPITIDKPYYFAVRDNNTGALIFTGSIINP